MLKWAVSIRSRKDIKLQSNAFSLFDIGTSGVHSLNYEIVLHYLIIAKIRV